MNAAITNDSTSTPRPEFHHVSVDPMDNNCWLIAVSGQALLIDAANDAPRLLSLAKDQGLTITDVLTTHQHGDHVQALSEVLEATGARHHAPRLDADALPAAADRTYGNDEGTWEALDLAGDNLRALGLTTVELRGHTPGGLAVLYEDITEADQVWVGDSVFPGGVGKTQNAADFAQLLADVDQRIFSLPESTAIHPGHGDSTTVGAEKPQVPEWRARGW